MGKILKLDIAQYKGCDITEEELSKLVDCRSSFVLKDIKTMDSVLAKVEKVIELKGLSCRIFSSNRSWLMAAGIIPIGITQVIGAWSTVVIGIHNLFTINPDYEIEKGFSSLKVIYKRG